MGRFRVISVGLGVLLVWTAAAFAAGHIEASTKFLLAWGKGNWDDLASVAADKVIVTVGGKEATIDVAGKKADAALVFPFKGLSTVRVGGEVKGVTVDEITVKLGGDSKTGKGTLTIEDRGGKAVITRVAVE
ncbi:MAG TPA: hypothetical protein VFN71_12805 [Methylomirabilota bacterium]|nr:hypothetical protein [Methylomirabilota bacterium]